MSDNFLIDPVFWIGIYLMGYTIAIAVLSLPRALNRVENRIPKPLIRIFTLSTFIVPIIALPFTEGPKMEIPTPVALIIGIILLGMNFIIKISAQKQIGTIPALKGKGRLVTTGIYGTVRNPLYLSNGLLAMGMAILFRSLYAFLFSIPYFLSYLLIIRLEEKDLLEKYGKEYQEYRKKVPWRMIPKLL